ncbi:MAG: response regulator [Deinococcus sp.]|nr:response regulator [Deinococcus sp.]
MAGERLLVIHDYPGTRTWLVDLLTTSGYQTRGVPDLAAACLAYQRQRPDVVILLLTGNEAARLQLVQALRTTPETRQSRCLMLVEGAVSPRLRRQAQGLDTIVPVDLASAQVHQMVQAGLERTLGHWLVGRG